MPRKLHPHSPLKPLKKDKRDFKLGYVFQLPKLGEIPTTDWMVDVPLEIKTQNDDECTAFAAAAVAEDHEGVILDPHYTFSREKLILGNKDEYGGDLRAVAKAAVKFGFLEKSKSPYPNADRNTAADWNKWSLDCDADAEVHKQKSYFLVEGPYDFFDNLRAALWLFRKNKNSALAGSYWFPDWLSRTVIDSFSGDANSAHAFKTRIGQKIINGFPFLAIQQSYGPNIGDHGTQYFSRSVVNSEWKDFGAFMFVDMDPNEVAQPTLMQRLQRAFDVLVYFLSFYARRKPVPVEPDPPQPVPLPQPTPTPPPAPKYLWDTPANARHSVRVICDEYGLSPRNKDVICAVIQGESGFDPQKENHNPDGTTDYGISQLNSFWYIGPKQEVKTPEQAKNDPETCVRVMVKAFKAGRISDWIAYRNGSYLKYMPKVGSIEIPMQIPSWLQSSDGSGDLSLRVKSFLLALLPLAYLAFKVSGHELGSGSLEDLVNEVGNFVAALTGLIAIVLHINAWARRNVYKQAGTGAFSK